MSNHIDRHGLNTNAIKTSVDLLNARLAEAIDLSLMTKQAHWNIRGPNFIALHEMLDGLRGELDGHVDTLAERAVQLGGMALGTSQIVAERTPLKAYPTDTHRIPAHMTALADSFAQSARLARQSIAEADEAGDLGTADIFTAYSLMLDKSLWLLDAHGHGSQGSAAA